MKLTTCTILICTCVLAARGQGNGTLPPVITASMTLDRLLNANGIGTTDLLYGMPPPEGGVTGHTYLDSSWRRTTFLRYDGGPLLEGYKARYAIDRHEFELRSAAGVRVLAGSKIKSFVWLDSTSSSAHYFLNGKEYTTDDSVSLETFFEVLADGPIPLLKAISLQILPANYKVQFDIGSRNDRIRKKEKFYYAMGKTVAALPRSRRNILLLFPDHRQEVEEFIRFNAIDVGKSHHLKAVFEYYNALPTN